MSNILLRTCTNRKRSDERLTLHATPESHGSRGQLSGTATSMLNSLFRHKNSMNHLFWWNWGNSKYVIGADSCYVYLVLWLVWRVVTCVVLCAMISLLVGTWVCSLACLHAWPGGSTRGTLWSPSRTSSRTAQAWVGIQSLSLSLSTSLSSLLSFYIYLSLSSLSVSVCLSVSHCRLCSPLYFIFWLPSFLWRPPWSPCTAQWPWRTTWWPVRTTRTPPWPSVRMQRTSTGSVIVPYLSFDHAFFVEAFLHHVFFLKRHLYLFVLCFIFHFLCLIFFAHPFPFPLVMLISDCKEAWIRRCAVQPAPRWDGGLQATNREAGLTTWLEASESIVSINGLMSCVTWVILLSWSTFFSKKKRDISHFKSLSKKNKGW